jgi:hypothetical protein
VKHAAAYVALLAALVVPLAAQETRPPASARERPAGPAPLSLPAAEEVHRWSAPEARQGVAVDALHFYAVVNSRIGKYRKVDGAKVGEWIGDGITIRHLNSCVVDGGELICANSNYPDTPMASSVEIFDTASMQHLRSIPLGVRDGSLTIVEPHEGRWWAILANYDPPRSYLGRTHRDTRIAIFNEDWAEVGGYALPESLLARLAPHSVSGGSFGEDGLLYLTGHDAAEIYVMRVPRLGPVVEHIATIPAPLEGQAWAWDRSATRTLYAIRRSTGEVVMLRLPSVPHPGGVGQR